MDSAKLYSRDILNSLLELNAEIHFWKNKQDTIKTDVPQNAVMARRDDFIKILLQMVATFPLSTASPERSFSTLKRLENYLRSTMTKIQLYGLTVLNIHQKYTS